jgi:hypothetical protein
MDHQYDKNLILELKNQIINNINDFVFSKDIIDKMKGEIITNNRLKECVSIIEIKNNEIKINYIGTVEKNRTMDIIKLIKNSIDYIKKKK